MSRQYKRRAQIDIISESGSIRIDGLRISFTVTKTLIGYPNLAKISIYNISDKTYGILTEDNARVVFNAGYIGNIRLMFSGNIRNVVPIREGEDRKVDIYAADGERDLQQSFFNKTLSENISLKSIISEIAEGFEEVVPGELLGIDFEPDKIRGQTLSGSSKDILNQLAADYGFEWSIQNGELVTVPDDGAIGEDDAILVSRDSGMIGSPIVTEIGADVKMLLNPDVYPNRIIKIESGSPSIELGNLFFRKVKKTKGLGFYKVIEVEHSGDTHGNDWYSLAKGRNFVA